MAILLTNLLALTGHAAAFASALVVIAVVAIALARLFKMLETRFPCLESDELLSMLRKTALALLFGDCLLLIYFAVVSAGETVGAWGTVSLPLFLIV